MKIVEEKRTEDTIIPVMHCFDNNYVVPAAVSFYSMLENACKKYTYKLYVLHSDITVQNQIKLSRTVQQFPNASLEFINMSNRFVDLWSELQFSGHYSKEVLYKLLISSIFPQYDKMIITDVDVAFLGDISESYFSFRADERILFAGVRQIMPKNTWLEKYYKNYIEHFGKGSLKKLKICGGYIVANLHQLREQQMEEKFVAFLKENTYRLLQSEQDVINFCCDESAIKYLPLNYVVCSYQYDIFDSFDKMDADPFYSREQIKNSMDKPIQLHYATGNKPWKDYVATKADVWFYYLSKCGMFYDYMKKEQALREASPEYLSNIEIRKGRDENRSPMIVSVLCCTYNHEEFIRETLEGLVNQKVDFPYEIIVADDCSQDATQEIIREYYERYPKLIRPILREENVGIGVNYYDALKCVEGRFLAICDGDDCWIDMFKLKKQVDFLMSNVEYNVCCSSCIKHNVGTGEDIVYSPEEYIRSAITLKESYSLKDLLYCRFVTSCTVMFRWQLRDNVPEFLRKHEVIDFPLVLIHAAGGKVKVMDNEVFARYNLHEKGITSEKNDKVEQETFCIINEVNQFLEYRFSKTVLDYMNSYKEYVAWVRKVETEKKLEAAKLVNQKQVDDVVRRITCRDMQSAKEDENIDEKGISNIVNVEEGGSWKRIARRLKDILCWLYRECVPDIIKRLWRLMKKIPIVIYRECVPDILKKGYRKIKKVILRNY